ncbi:MAG: BTAD domain-containing putative transcriptional regulator [Ilumatobacter sp.]
MTHRAVEEASGSQPVTLGVRVFGPTTVLIGGHPVDLGRRQVRQLVVAFAAAGGWVSADALVDHLWARALPEHPRKALNVALSRLRSALGDQAHRVEASGSDYRLLVDSADVDEFARLIDSARTLDEPAAIRCYEQALDLWSAPPFSDELDSPFVASRRQRLEELRWFAIVRLAELCNEVGQPERAVEVSALLLDDAVVRERAVIAHAVALGLLGRKSEALAVVGQAIGQLREGLGLEPSGALLDTERSLLADGVDLDAGSVKRTRPATTAFVGRLGELATLRQIDRGRWVSVIAEAGTGKSALLDQFSREVSEGGGRVVRINVSATPERPLDTIARLCLGLFELSPGDHPPNSADEFASSLARVCPELGFEAAGSLTREALVDQLADFIEARGADALIVIDDAHWIDSGSAEVVSRLLRRGRLSLVIGMRPTDDPRLAFLQVAETTDEATLADDASPGRCEPSYLPPFSRHDVIELVESCSTRQVHAGFIDDLTERSGGNALFLRLLIDRWAEGNDQESELPASILVTVSERLDLLARSVVDTLKVAAAVGSRFELHTIRQLRPNADAELAAAAAAGLVRVDDSEGEAVFLHVVVADACYQLLGEGRRIAVHEDIAFALEGERAPLAELARHHVAAATLDPSRAVWTSIRAAGEFTVGFDWETALQHLDTAASIVDRFDLGDLSLRAHVRVRRGAVGRMLLSADYVDDLYLGADLARDADETELFVVAVTELCGHGQTTRAGDIDHRVEELLNEALALPIERGLRAELCAASVPLFSTSSQADRGRELYREAWNIAQDLDDAQVELVVVSHAHLGFAHPDDFDLLAHAARRMTQLAGSDVDVIWEAAFVRFQCAVITGEAQDAEQALDEMRLYTPRIVGRSREFGLAFSECAHARLRGDLEAAEQDAETTLATGLERFDPSWAMTIYGMLLIGIRRAQGRVVELGPAVAAMLAGQPDYPPFHALAAMIAVEDGALDTARAHLDVVAENRFSNVVRDVHFTSVMLFAAAAVAAVGTPEEIDALASELEPFSGRMSWNGASSDGAIDGALALLADARGDHEAANEYRRAADALEQRFRRPPPKNVSASTAPHTTNETNVSTE